MFLWTPPPRTRVTFAARAVGYHPSIVPPGGHTVEAAAALERAFCTTFKLRYLDSGHASLRLDDPRWPAMLDEIEASEARGELSLRNDRGAAWLEEPKPSATDPRAWFDMDTAGPEFRRPDLAREGVHYAWSESGEVASERFRDAVTAAGLTGLDWIPLAGRPNDPMRWFDVFATHPLGRGLDHPLIDETRLPRRQGKNFHRRPRRRGEDTAWLQDFREDAVLDHPIADRLRHLAHPRFFRVNGHLRFAAEHLPPCDFAFASWPWQDDDGPAPPGGRRRRGIACNQRARAVLIESGVMLPKHFRPIPIVAAADARAAILDEVIDAPLPLPRFTPDEAAAERSRRPGTAPPPKPRRINTIEQARAELSRMQAEGPPWWSTPDPASLERIRSAKLFPRLPEAWKAVLDVLPVQIYEGDNDRNPVQFALAIPHRNQWTAGGRPAEPEDAPSRKDIVVAESPFGDWFAFRDTKGSPEADARLVYWDHETCLPHDEWPSVLQFVEHLIDIAPRATGSPDLPE